MRFFTISIFARIIYPGALFRIKTKDKVLCLTFDDGPDPDSTPELLDILQRHNIKAAFFCNGRAAELYPDLVRKIRMQGHVVGNHGYNHLNGWGTSLKDYCRDVDKAVPFTSGTLFRPPFGLLRINQYRKLRNTFKVVFWDVMPYDFDRDFEPARSLRILYKRIRPGSVIVLHDSQESASRIFLNEFLEGSVRKGYAFTCTGLQ